MGSNLCHYVFWLEPSFTGVPFTELKDFRPFDAA